MQLKEQKTDDPDLTKDDITNKLPDRKLLYRIDESPPWYLLVILGFQHYLTMFGATVGLPFILAGPLCYSNNPVVISEIISTIFFASGIATLLQTTIGSRLPIIQGGTYTFLAPTFAIMGVRGACPATNQPGAAATTAAAVNSTLTATSVFLSSVANPTTASLLGNITSTAATMAPSAGDEEWKIRMREIQGAIIVASFFQIIIGFGGIIGLIIKFIGPLTIVPTIALVGLPLFDVAYNFAATQWGVSITMIFLVTLFSQVLRNVPIPLPTYSRRDGFTTSKIEVFKLFPILIAIVVCWSLCAILTFAGAFPNDKSHASYKARTDARLSVLTEVSWFRVPYPGQWGMPTVSAAAVFGMLAGVLGSMIESVGDYYACARLAGAPPPPRHALNRGIGMEGIGCVLTGAWGTGNGTTSYSENIGAIGITRVGSRRVIQAGAVIMMVLAVIGKFGALFTTIPDPVIGGIFIVMFGMITAVGLSTLQYCDLNSMRNLFVLGLSLFFGMVLPFWIKSKPDAIRTGSNELDQILTVLFSTNMAVGGLTGFMLDNLLPGTDDERGISKWRRLFAEEDGSADVASVHTYDIPVITKLTQKLPLTKYVPFLPYYKHGSPELATNV